MSIPPFTPEGLLPPFDYVVTFDELRASQLVTGHGVGSATWDRNWRSVLVDNLEELVGQLWQVGIDRIFVNGSFVEDRDHPNDIDGYFECDEGYFTSGDLARDLAKQNRHVWDWSEASRWLDPRTFKPQLPMWHRYRVELYPHFGQPSGIFDRFGNHLAFPAAFRRTHAFEPKGILQIVKPGRSP